MHNRIVEMQGKCRRLIYAKVDGPPFVDIDGNPLPGPLQYVAGDILGLVSAGGAIEDLTGDDLIIATFNDPTAPERIGVIEEFYNPVPSNKPLRVDLTKIGACSSAVDAHRAAKQAEADFVFETGITMFGAEPANTEAFRQRLKVQEVATRGQSTHDTIVTTQTELDALSKKCDDCCDELLTARDAAVTFGS